MVSLVYQFPNSLKLNRLSRDILGWCCRTEINWIELWVMIFKVGSPSKSFCKCPFTKLWYRRVPLPTVKPFCYLIEFSFSTHYYVGILETFQHCIRTFRSFSTSMYPDTHIISFWTLPGFVSGDRPGLRDMFVFPY